jgi:UDP-2,3-diacylglucosamine pyrophosphatase LpxH
MVKRALIIPDCHIPYEDKRAYDLMLTVAKDVDPDEIVILGDYADFYAVNSHGKDAAVENGTLEEEVTRVVERLIEIKKLFPKAKRVFIEGNHEYRLARYINSKCPDLYGVFDTKSVLELGILGYEFVPYGPNQKYRVLGSKLIARHEPLAGGKHVAQNTVEKAMHSVIFGHTHRIQEAQVVTIDGENYRGISSGWLGDTQHRIFEYVKGHHQWAHAFSVVNVLDDGTWFNQLIHIINYKCYYDGHIYEN